MLSGKLKAFFYCNIFKVLATNKCKLKIMRGRNFNGLGSLSGHASSMITSLRNNFRKKDFDYYIGGSSIR